MSEIQRKSEAICMKDYNRNDHMENTGIKPIVIERV